MKKSLKITEIIRELNESISLLRDFLPKIMGQRIWQHKVTMSEKLEYLAQLASQRNRLWREVESIYPELKGKNYTVNSYEISYEEEVTPKP